MRRLLKQPCFLSQLSSSLEERREIKDSANVIININLLLIRRKIALKIWSNTLNYEYFKSVRGRIGKEMGKDGKGEAGIE